MKNMILAATLLSFLMSCGKDLPPQNFLPGQWNLTQSELYQQDTLAAVSHNDEVNTVYYFGSCDNSDQGCEMYIEEDGEKNYYTYLFDDQNKTLLLGENSIFHVAYMNENELVLTREYDIYRSTYRFSKSE